MVHGAAVLRLTAREEVRIVPEGSVVGLRGGNGGTYERVLFVSGLPGRAVRLNGRPYRGVVEVYNRGGRLIAVNEVSLEDYVAGVVNVELGPRPASDRAAVEAQAIVARTYALGNRGKYGSDGFDLRSSVADQVYGGVESETDVGRQAVAATRGMVLTYRGALIATFYHSTCGGRTASPEEAFRTGQALPYLRPVSDRRPDGADYCSISPRYRWSVEWDGMTLRGILRRTIPEIVGLDSARVDVIRGMRVHRRGASGRAAEVRVGVGAGEIPIFAADIRAVLAPAAGGALGSTAIELDVDTDQGVVTRLVARGSGWGHGVGLCQWGAIGRARAGQNATTILESYFPGTQIARWY
jgi:stage II sporulation protein D